MTSRIEIDCEQLMQIANDLRGNAQTTLGHVEQTIHDAEFTADAYGVVASGPIRSGGEYEMARQSYQFGVHSAWGFLDVTTKGLAETAQAFASAEAANTLTTTLDGAFRTALGYVPNPIESDKNRFADIGANEIIDIAVAPMMEIWLYAMGWIDACVDLAPLLIEAIVLFGLIQPDDAEIQLVVQRWQVSAQALDRVRTGVDRALGQDVPAAWPSVPDSFAEWRTKIAAYLDNLAQSIAKVPGFLAAAADRVNQANKDLLYVLEAAFAALTAATALDVFFGVGESVKLAISIGVLVAIQVGFLAILGDLRGIFGAMPQVPPLPLPQLGGAANAQASDWIQLPNVAQAEADSAQSIALVRDING